MSPLPLWIPLLLAAATGRDLEGTLRVTPAESLSVVLRRIEASPGLPEQGGVAAQVLGQLHYARGEYRAAANAYARAAARLDPARKPEARYWAGLCWLALGDVPQARSALDEVAESSAPQRPLALLALAESWELAGKPDRAFELLGRLLAGDPGEAGPTALARYAALAERFGQPAEARRAWLRLVREYPASMEAASARLAGSGTTPSGRPGR